MDHGDKSIDMSASFAVKKKIKWKSLRRALKTFHIIYIYIAWCIFLGTCFKNEVYIRVRVRVLVC